MIQAATLPLVGNRWTPFVYSIAIYGKVLLGASVAMEVRLTFDTPGEPLLSISTSNGILFPYVGSDTVANHIAAGRILAVPKGMAADDNLDLSLIKLSIPEASMEAMPFPPERGDDAVFRYDIVVAPSGGTEEVWFRGTFTVRAGATQ